MTLRAGTIFLAFSLFAGSPVSAQAPACGPARTALVLSGGGAKGMAHIGVLRVLDSLGIVPDLIVGTSIGSLVGALYASGYSGSEIDSIVRTSPGGTIIHTFDPTTPRVLGTKQPMLTYAQGDEVSGLQTNALNEREVNALLEEKLFIGNLRARGNFDSLPIPFRAVATDLRTHKAVVLGTGDLPRAVRASISIPIVFTPVFMNDMYLVDGGLTANVPVAIARALGAERVIVSDLSVPQSDTIPLFSSDAVMSRLMDYLADQPLPPMGPDDILVKFNVGAYGTLDFAPQKVQELMALGQREADSAFAGVSCLNPLNQKGRRIIGLPRYVGAITAPGKDNPAVSVLGDLGLKSGDSINYHQLRKRSARMGETSLIDAVWLYPGGHSDTVSFAPVVRPAPRIYGAAGIAYDNILGGEVWLGGITRNLLGLGLETSTLLRLGGLRDEIGLAVRKNLRYGWRTLAPTLSITGGNERVPVYVDNTEITSLHTEDLVGFVGVERTMGDGWIVALGAVGVLWNDPDTPDGAAGGARVKAERFRGFDAMQVLVEASYTSTYRRGLAEIHLPWTKNRVGVHGLLRIGAGSDLPLQYTFVLGGTAGFPGVKPGQLRGSYEASGQAELWFRMLGPLEAQLVVGGGSISEAGHAFASGSWLGGVRAGLGAHTPFGPIKAGYGWATGGRETLFVQVFRWF